jgi:hypothetical protein
VIRDWLLRATTSILLGGWLGSWGLFAFVVAPTAFQVLPSQAAAGDLVAPVLADLHHYGMAAGLLVAALSALRRLPWPLVAAPLVLAALCAITQYGITPAINAVEPRTFGPGYEEEAALRFSQLHQSSRYLFGTILLGVSLLIAAHAWPVRARKT